MTPLRSCKTTVSAIQATPENTCCRHKRDLDLSDPSNRVFLKTVRVAIPVQDLPQAFGLYSQHKMFEPDVQIRC